MSIRRLYRGTPWRECVVCGTLTGVAVFHVDHNTEEPICTGDLIWFHEQIPFQIRYRRSP